jgi:hypothetical protein
MYTVGIVGGQVSPLLGYIDTDCSPFQENGDVIISNTNCDPYISHKYNRQNTHDSSLSAT